MAALLQAWVQRRVSGWACVVGWGGVELGGVGGEAKLRARTNFEQARGQAPGRAEQTAHAMLSGLKGFHCQVRSQSMGSRQSQHVTACIENHTPYLYCSYSSSW